RAGQFGAVAEPRPPAGPVPRPARRRRIPRRRAAHLIGAARLRRASVVVAQLKLLVAQGDRGARRAAAVLGGLARGLIAGLGQALTDAGPERELQVETGRERRRVAVRAGRLAALLRPHHLHVQAVIVG